MLSNKAMMAAPAAEPLYIEDVFSTYLYTGNGSTQTITNGIDLAGEGGLVWIKPRSGYVEPTTYGHLLFDTSRGVKKAVFSNRTNAQVTSSNEGLTNFNFNGFGVAYGVGTDLGGVNENTASIVSWTFRKAPKFFDVVTYTGNGATNRQINHNLGSAPGMVIAKCTNTTSDWFVWHRSLAGTNYNAYLNDTLAAGAYADFSSNGSGTMSSTSFCVNGSSNINGNTYVAYLFAHDAGGFGEAGDQNVVSCGSFMNGPSFHLPLVELGWEPQFLLIKRSLVSDPDAINDWVLYDTMRGLTVENGSRLAANTASGEAGASALIKITNTGFIPNFWSGANSTYIYLAIRRGPMKTPTVGTSVFSPTLWTGTNTTTTIGGIGFPPDALFEKSRATANAPEVYDRMRGLIRLLSSETDAEIALVASYDITAYGQNGYNLGPALYSSLNFSGRTNVLYNFRRAPGFFDVVCYTGNGSGIQTINHNLGTTPEFMIVKRRNAGGTGGSAGFAVWNVWHKNIVGVTRLNSNAAVVTSPTFLSEGTATTFPAHEVSGSFESTNSGGGATYVAYLFATVPNVSKVGSYTGTGTTLQINCGFTTGARFVMIKRTDSTGDWYVWDTARGIIAGNDPYLLLNTTAAEVTNTDYIDPLSSGFEISSTAPAAINANGGTFVFLAIA